MMKYLILAIVAICGFSGLATADNMTKGKAVALVAAHGKILTITYACKDEIGVGFYQMYRTVSLMTFERLSGSRQLGAKRMVEAEKTIKEIVIRDNLAAIVNPEMCYEMMNEAVYELQIADRM